MKKVLTKAIIRELSKYEILNLCIGFSCSFFKENVESNI